MKIDNNKVEEVMRALCATYKLDYYEFIRPSKSPRYIDVRSVLIHYFKSHGLTQKQIAPLTNLDHSNVSRNNTYAKSHLLTTKKGMRILSTIETLIFKQSMGVGLVFEQLTYERIANLRKTK